MGTQMEHNENRLKYLAVLKEQMPDLVKIESEKWDEVYRDGALDSKTKRLIALGIALRAGCRNCIIAQTIRALDQGATKEEILETAGVNISMSGTTGVAESLRVLELLEELGHI